MVNCWSGDFFSSECDAFGGAEVPGWSELILVGGKSEFNTEINYQKSIDRWSTSTWSLFLINGFRGDEICVLAVSISSREPHWWPFCFPNWLLLPRRGEIWLVISLRLRQTQMLIAVVTQYRFVVVLLRFEWADHLPNWKESNRQGCWMFHSAKVWWICVNYHLDDMFSKCSTDKVFRSRESNGWLWPVRFRYVESAIYTSTNYFE